VHSARVYALAFSPDDDTLASAGADGRVVLWNRASRPQVREIPCIRDANHIPFVSDDTLGASRTDGVCHVDLRTGQPIDEFATEGSPRCVAVSKDGNRLAVGSANGKIEVWDLRKRSRIMQGDLGLKCPIDRLSFSPEADNLAAISWNDKAVRLWAVPSGQRLAEIETEGCTAVAFSPHGGQFAVSSEDRVLLVNCDTDGVLAELRGHTSTVQDLAFSPKGRLLASASKDRTILVWDVETQEVRFVLDGHRGDVLSVTFSPDGRSLLSAGEDGSIKAWHVATGQELVELRRAPHGWRKVLISPKAQRVACLAFTGQVFTIDVSAHRPKP
jgi:WD40 repeat protein